MKILLLSYLFDGTDVGEPYVAFQIAKSLVPHAQITLLSFERPGRVPLKEQAPSAEVVTWSEPAFVRKAERFNNMAKPAYPLLYRKVKRWVRQKKAQGEHFDIAHQVMPLATRYPSPFQGEGIPYVIGPLGGGLPTLPGFVSEVKTARWYTKLRNFDQLRLKADPWLRRSYSQAELILGVAPYVQNALSSIPIKKFETFLELGIRNLAPERPPRTANEFRLLHVGRGVRTKGLRDVIRALALLSDIKNISLISAGSGEDISLCQKEVRMLGLDNKVTFLGHVARDEIEQLYQEADLFVFPSFREPTGGVLYEAMRWGLPLITVDYGGPATITDESCAIRLPVSTPEALARDIADAVRMLHDNPDRRLAMGLAARDRVAAEGLWENKAKRLIHLYNNVLADRS